MFSKHLFNPLSFGTVSWIQYFASILWLEKVGWARLRPLSIIILRYIQKNYYIFMMY